MLRVVQRRKRETVGTDKKTPFRALSVAWSCWPMVLRERERLPDPGGDYLFLPPPPRAGRPGAVDDLAGKDTRVPGGVEEQAAASDAAARPSAIFVFMMESFAVGLARVSWRRVTTR
jgi:hypothetical protein